MARKSFLQHGRRGWLTLALLGVIFLGAPRGWAELRFDVFVGYDGTVREATWFPITCEIFNDGPAFTGFIEVAPGMFGKGQTQRLPIELPTGTLKRVMIPAFAPNRYQTPWDVRLIDSRNKVRAEVLAAQAQRHVGWETKLMGSLPRSTAGAVSLRNIKRNQPDMQPAVARFQPAMFPDNPLVLEGLDAIYLNSETAVALRASQVNALLAWLNAGGQLIVAIEQIADVTGVPWLQKVLPCEPRDIVAVPVHDELQAWVREGFTVTNYPPAAPKAAAKKTAAAPKFSRPEIFVTSAFTDQKPDEQFARAEIRVVTGPRRDGRVVVAVAGTPLIVTADRGLGRVTALLFSPEREPFKSWQDLPTFWTKLLEVPASLYTSTDYYPGYGLGADGLFGAMIDSRQVHKLPVGWLLGLLVVYLLIIGPVDRFWLLRINRPMLTWLTFPCYVLGFSGLIYLIGYRLRAGETEVNELHVVDVLPQGERAELRGRTYASIYSPANASYPMQSGLKYATLRGEYLASRGGETSERTALRHTGDNFKAEVFVPVWTSQLYLSDWWSSANKPLVATLQRLPRAQDGWLLKVENRSGKPISAARLAVDSQFFDVGEIAAGQTKTVTLNRSGDYSLMRQNFVSGLIGQYHSVVQQRQYAFGRRDSGKIDDLSTASMVASLLGDKPEQRGGPNFNFVAAPGLDLSAVIDRGHAVLLAWAPDTAPVPPLFQGKAKRAAAQTLWRLPISVQTTN